MAATLTLTLAACAAPAPEGPRGASGPVRVPGLANWQGLEARQRADAQCGPRGVRASIQDRYQGGEWVYPEGCA